MKRRSPRGSRGRLGLWTFIAVVVLLVAYLGVLELSRPHVSGDPLRLDTFVTAVQDGRVRTAKLLDVDGFAVGTYERRDGSVATYNAPYLKMSLQPLVDLLLEERVATTVDQQNGKRVAALASLLLPGLILVVLFVYLILSYRSGTGLFGIRSGARQIKPGEVDVGFSDVAGQDAAVAELREVADFLADPERFLELGARLPKGVLLYGPPGCGKTLMARALAGQAGAAFYSISGSDFVELYVGVGASRVRELFKQARQNAPAIVFIDELDSVGRRRGGASSTAGGARQEQEQALNQILAEMDGFSPRDALVVVGATNRPDVLDPALLRPGRFDRGVGLEAPDESARLAILRLHARGKKLAPSANLAAVAARSIGMTGADLASVMNEAALLAVRRGRDSVTQVDLEGALTRILETPERQRRLAMRDRNIGRTQLDSERVHFIDVAGVDDAIEELAEIKEYLRDPERFERLGARVPRGYLLAGPPGCGKTLLARAVATESNAAFFSVAGTEFVEVFVGEGSARVRDLFAQAKSLAPSIIFIDEIDAIGARRGASLDGHREREQTLNQILIELDGFGHRTGVIVIAATNRPDILDPALVRAGRFDRHVMIDLPDRAAREAILDVHLRGVPAAPDVNLQHLAGLTRGLSGAELANLVNEAGLLAARRGAEFISMRLLEEALERASLGISSRGRVLSDEERKRVAYHEAGHAIAAATVPGGRVPHRVSVIPRGRALGASWHLEARDRVIQSRSDLIDQMVVLLAGRAAEEAIFGESAGAADDLRRVAELARQMVVELGMADSLGALSFTDGSHLPYSQQTLERIDGEVSKLVMEAMERAHDTLRRRRDALDRVAAALAERETLEGQEIRELAGV